MKYETLNEATEAAITHWDDQHKLVKYDSINDYHYVIKKQYGGIVGAIYSVCDGNVHEYVVSDFELIENDVLTRRSNFILSLLKFGHSMCLGEIKHHMSANIGVNYSDISVVLDHLIKKNKITIHKVYGKRSTYSIKP